MALIFDLETDGLLEEVTKIHCLVFKDTETGDIWKFIGGTEHEEIEDGLLFLKNADLIVGHNVVKYDIPVIKKLYPWFEPNCQIRDTILCTRLIWPHLKELDFANTFPALPKNLYGRHSLESWGYRLGVLKGEFGKGTDWKEFSQEMLQYCVQDVEVTAKLWEKIQSKNYSEQAIQLEHEFAEVIHLQEQHGFCFDREAAVKLYSELGQKRASLETELKKVFPGWTQDMKVPDHWTVSLPSSTGAIAAMKFATKGEAQQYCKEKKIRGATYTAGPVRQRHIEFNPSSRQHVARALIERHGWKPKEFTDGSAQPRIDEEVLSQLHYPEAKLLCEYYLVEKRIGQLAEGSNAWLKLEVNGKIHGEVVTNGAVTGRCTHRNPNMAQVPGVGAPYGNECRSLFIVPGGYKLVGCDASGLELRCLAHFMARYDGGAYANELLRGDIHTANQQAAGLATRGDSKKFIYMFLYGAGDEHIGQTFGKGAKWGRALKARFLENLPALKRLKEDVTIAAKRGHLIGIDGRLLPIRSEHSALNTLLQSAGALIVKKATVILHKNLLQRGWEFGREWTNVAHIHDELQIEAKEEVCEEVGKSAVNAMRLAGQQFNFRCPIDGEYKIGRSWAECH